MGGNENKRTLTLKTESNTTYQQHRRYFIKTKKSTKCPQIHFRKDLMMALQGRRDEGHKLIMCLDANEDVYKKLSRTALTEVNGLALMEIVGEFTGQKLDATYFRGLKQIDAVWASENVKISEACVMPTGYGIAEHRMFIIVIVTYSILGSSPHKIVRPKHNYYIAACKG